MILTLNRPWFLRLSASFSTIGMISANYAISLADVDHFLWQTVLRHLTIELIIAHILGG